MWLTRMAAGVVAAAMMGSPALAKTTVISELGEAPLVGRPIASTAELKHDFHERAEIFAQAGEKLGLNQREYDQFRVAIETSTPDYVEIPRHLDAMTGYWGGQVHVLHDVLIPKRTYGWQVVIPERGGNTLIVYVPNKCGNVSFVRRIAPHVAARKIVPQPVAQIPPAVAPVAITPAAPPAVVAPAAAAPVGSELPVAAVASHGAGFLPFVGAALIPFIPFFTSGGGGNTTSSSPPPTPLCPNQ